MSRFKPLGYRQVSGISASTTLQDIPRGATVVMVRADAQAVRWRDDGTDPTASIGMPLSAGDTLVYEGDLSAIAFIEQAAGAVLDVAYYA